MDGGRRSELCDTMAIDDSVSLPGTGPLAFASFSFDPHDPSEVVVPSTLIGQRGDQAWVTTIHAPGVEPEVVQSARIDSTADRSHVSLHSVALMEILLPNLAASAPSAPYPSLLPLSVLAPPLLPSLFPFLPSGGFD